MIELYKRNYKKKTYFEKTWPRNVIHQATLKQLASRDFRLPIMIPIGILIMGQGQVRKMGMNWKMQVRWL